MQGSIKNIEFSDVNNNAYNPADVNFTMTLKGGSTSQIITFADPAVKALCVANWDTNGDGELSEAEAAAVTDLGTVFEFNSDITSFNELQYFTGLTSIGIRAFYWCFDLTSVTIPNSVTSIGDYAFNWCALTSITIPESVTSIGYEAFEKCKGLSSIIIPNSVTSIERGAFANCNLTSIVVELGNTMYYSRDNCNAIISRWNTLIAGCENTIIPESVTSIGNAAFSGCSGLTSITIPESVTRIGESAFADCSGLTSITIPNSVTYISYSAFSGCRGLTSITIPNSVTYIGDNPFANCPGLTSIVVDFGNTKYDSRDNCNAIIETASNTLIAGCMNTIIPESVTSIGFRAFFDCSGLTSVTIPNSVTSIDHYAFERCKGLSSIIIPNSVTSIGSGAFTECKGLTSVTIGSGVTSIGREAFSFNDNLQSIICYAMETPEVDGYAFYHVDVSNVTLQVPRESEQKYKDHPVWGKFKIEVIDGIEDVRSGESGEDFERNIYDLSGRRLPAGRKPQGIYIRNGKKIAVK